MNHFLVNGLARFPAGTTTPIYDADYKAWRTDNGLLSDPLRLYAITQETPASPPPSIGPNEFHFLWTVPEQIKIAELRKTDAGLDLFMQRLDDPRTTEVVLAAPAIQNAIAYTVHVLAGAGVIAPDQVQTRIDQISQGEPA